MADLGQNRHFFPATIIPSKVVHSKGKTKLSLNYTFFDYLTLHFFTLFYTTLLSFFMYGVKKG